MVGIKLDLTMGVLKVFFLKRWELKNGPLPQLYR